MDIMENFVKICVDMIFKRFSYILGKFKKMLIGR